MYMKYFIFELRLQLEVKYEIFHIYTPYGILHIISLLTGRYEPNKLISLSMWSFITQLLEHRAGIHGFESLWSPDFFRLLSNCLNWKIYCDDYSSLLEYGIEDK